ncbi:MAG: amidohydrolase [Candidatus Zhuqueibacterota bacterium]
MSRNEIIFVGASAEARAFSGRETKVVDLRGSFGLPGFNDAHLHFADGCYSLVGVDLRPAKNETDFVQRIAEYARKTPAGTWITEGNWDHEVWPGQKHPTRDWIDAVTPQHPVFVSRIDYHIALANSLALELAGITKDTPNPPGGEIGRDPNTGELTGILVDKAWDLIFAVRPVDDAAQALPTFKVGLNYAAELGITSFQDNCTKRDFQAYQLLHKRGELTARVNAWFSIDMLDHFEQIGFFEDFGNDMLRVGVMKIYVDGSMGAGSAYFYEPYTDNPATCGLLLNDEGQLNELVLRADAAGLQIAAHAIGDRANEMILNAFELAFANNKPRQRRHRVEHAQVVTDSDMARFRDLGIIASIQPSHCIDDMHWVEKRIGSARSNIAYRSGSFLGHGIPLAFGTDWPVESLDPKIGLYAAVTREDIHGGPAGGWRSEEKMSLDQAIKSYTLAPAFAEFSEGKKGSIEVGKLADLVILDKNLFDIRPEKILSVRVLYTVMDGKIVYQRES